ncbi:MAG: hypothetical protein ABEJ99_04570 [Candidatus Nanohaloarchaea archaeon]
MGLLKWLIPLILAPFTAGFSLLLYPFMIFWTWVKLAIKIDILMIKFVTVLIFYILSRPFVWAGHSLQRVAHFIQEGVELLEYHPKRYGIGYLVLAAMFLSFFPSFIFYMPSVPAMTFSDPVGGLFALLGFFVNIVFQNLLFVIVIIVPGVFLVLLGMIYHKFIGVDIPDLQPPSANVNQKLGQGKDAALGAAKGAASAAATGYRAADSAQGVYNDLPEDSRTKSNSRGADEIKYLFLDIGLDIGESVLGEGFGASLIGGVTAEGAAGAAAAAGAAIWPVLVVLLVALVIFGVTLAIQAIFVGALYMSAVSFILPIIAKPILGAVGVGAAYGDSWATQTQNRYLAGLQVSDQFQVLSEFGKKVECAAQGPACLRQWRLNHTKRPSSNDVGEWYGLKLDNFRVGSGKSVDIAYKDSQYALPISFQISNNRHGLKGIPARNIEFRLKMYDYDHSLNNPYCQTRWLRLGEQVKAPDGSMTHIPSAYDLDNDGNKDDLYPGTSAATGYLKLYNLTLENCHMLQPGAGQYRKIRLYVRYDYFSQATLYFKAMSRQYQNSQGIKIDKKESVTADTPVKAALGVDNPVLFDQNMADNDPGYAGQPASIVATLNARDTKVGYQVKDFKVRKSGQTCIMNKKGECLNWDSTQGACDQYDKGTRSYRTCVNAQRSLDSGAGSTGSGSDQPMQCSFKHTSGSRPNILELKENAKKRLIASQESGIPADHWFTKAAPPSLFGCILGLKNPKQINPSGETFTMGVAANYTVRLQEDLGSFQVLNSKCGSYNCPFVYAINGSFMNKNGAKIVFSRLSDLQDDSYKNDKWYWLRKEATCDGVDAGDGCSVYEDYSPYDPKPLKNILGHKAKMQSGQLAVTINRQMISDYRTHKNKDSGTVYSGLKFSCNVLSKTKGKNDAAAQKALVGETEKDTDIFGRINLYSLDEIKRAYAPGWGLDISKSGYSKWHVVKIKSGCSSDSSS